MPAASKVPVLRVTTPKDVNELSKQLNSLLRKVEEMLRQHETDIATLKAGKSNG